MLNEIINGNVFYLNKSPMKEHFWEKITRLNLTDEVKLY